MIKGNIKISIVTPTLNQAQYITDTIESVLNQNYKNFEHIVIDGNSNDGTLDILKSYKHIRWISEPDKGAANAINKGLKLTSGDVVTWLNSDDYYDSGVFEKVNELFSLKSELDFICGNLTYIDENKNILLEDKTHNYDLDYLINYSADVVRQPSTFFTKRLLKKTGFLDEDLKFAFDYELFIRMLKITDPYFVDKNFAFYRDYENTLTRKNLRKQSLEIFKISRKYCGKLFSKLNKQNLKKLILPESFIIKTEKN